MLELTFLRVKYIQNYLKVSHSLSLFLIFAICSLPFYYADVTELNKHPEKPFNLLNDN